MSATTTTYASSIELIPEVSSHERPDSDWQASTTPADPDNIVEASRLQDASVPDGGQGWAVVATCSLLCFWFG